MISCCNFRPTHPHFGHFGFGSILHLTATGFPGWIGIQWDLIPRRDRDGNRIPPRWTWDLYVAIGYPGGDNASHCIDGIPGPAMHPGKMERGEA